MNNPPAATSSLTTRRQKQEKKGLSLPIFPLLAGRKKPRPSKTSPYTPSPLFNGSGEYWGRGRRGTHGSVSLRGISGIIFKLRGISWQRSFQSSPHTSVLRVYYAEYPGVLCVYGSRAVVGEASANWSIVPCRYSVQARI